MEMTFVDNIGTDFQYTIKHYLFKYCMTFMYNASDFYRVQKLSFDLIDLNVFNVNRK